MAHNIVITKANKMMNFRDLQPGDKASIIGFDNIPIAYQNRLMSLGLIPGTVFSVKKRAPLGDPVAIEVRGFLLSLRADEARGMVVEKV